MRRIAGLVMLLAIALLTQACMGASGSTKGASRQVDRSPVAEQRAAPSSASPSVPSSAPATTRPSSRTGSPSGPDGSPPAGGKAKSERKKPRVLGAGDEGPKVRALQKALTSMHYDPGVVDGVFGGTTEGAVRAFQKVNGLRPDGTVGPKTRKALADPRVPRPLVPGGPGGRVEIDLTHQLLYVYKHDALALISHIPSGSGEYYCSENGCAHAVTPTGDYHTTWRVNGWRTSDLGRLYNPVYFVGGIAVHGAPYVPLYPASHGCVRIPMHTSTIFPGLVGHGEAVFVRRPLAA